MTTSISIPDSDLEGFSQHARDEIVKHGEAYVKELIKEAYRLEASKNLSGGPPEVTQSMVVSASHYQQNYQPAAKSKFQKFLSFATSLLGLLIGGMWDYDKFSQSAQYLVLFIVILCLGIAALTASLTMDR
ncbi:hypothetical protein L905_18980 [Agrobacterium sp. TS43]|uniref:hypothetical protein n=1 Tax=Agrobacterium TaxID=357 RepID=UPI00049FFFAC|nr:MULTISPECIES: hypothetical protein [Agrobacterium]KDR87687.1 hypothetical protein K538_06940 [Agrobacterium tumefaciens GW4]KVK49477.1 hypothetical protein L903_19335 [Agrobacterium sp. JL28]KVK49713.1 hypothetical protein L904_19320 [Agrobacterium sp. LY4]KVK62656.1 hypothetical protein L906_18455 [Agrobacterium sp. TS45]KVK65041.1 hypothetical protein L905_18980 [Agrobacterium sp. TS43]